MLRRSFLKMFGIGAAAPLAVKATDAFASKAKALDIPKPESAAIPATASEVRRAYEDVYCSAVTGDYTLEEMRGWINVHVKK